MTETLLLKLLHIVGLAYWLGGDLGVFYSSFLVSDATKSREVRIAAAKMLFTLDQAPRICMTLMLPLGIQLAWSSGWISFSAAVMAAIWVVAIAWMASVIFLHFGSSVTAKKLIAMIDYGLRLTLITALITTGLGSLLGDMLSLPYWLAWKLLIFGTLILLGLIVRLVLRDFGPAYVNMLGGEPSEADNAAIRRSLNRTRPFVVCIWIGLLLSSALGLHLI